MQQVLVHTRTKSTVEAKVEDFAKIENKDVQLLEKYLSLVFCFQATMATTFCSPFWQSPLRAYRSTDAQLQTAIPALSFRKAVVLVQVACKVLCLFQVFCNGGRFAGVLWCQTELFYRRHHIGVMYSEKWSICECQISWCIFTSQADSHNNKPKRRSEPPWPAQPAQALRIQ